MIDIIEIIERTCILHTEYEHCVCARAKGMGLKRVLKIPFQHVKCAQNTQWKMEENISSELIAHHLSFMAYRFLLRLFEGCLMGK